MSKCNLCGGEMWEPSYRVQGKTICAKCVLKALAFDTTENRAIVEAYRTRVKDDTEELTGYQTAKRIQAGADKAMREMDADRLSALREDAGEARRE